MSRKMKNIGYLIINLIIIDKNDINIKQGKYFNNITIMLNFVDKVKSNLKMQATICIAVR